MRAAIGDDGIDRVLTEASTPDELVHRVTALLEDMRAALDQTVALARRDGLSWEQIGQAAGLTRQSAHERWRWVDEIRTDDAA